MLNEVDTVDAINNAIHELNSIKATLQMFACCDIENLGAPAGMSDALETQSRAAERVADSLRDLISER